MKKLLLSLITCASFVCVQGLRANDQPVYHETLVNSIGANAVSVNGAPNLEILKSKKYLFIYYSAHWCPPCRMFTPELVEFYNKNHENGDFDLLFVSLDKGPREMNTYMRSEKMPWIGMMRNSKPGRALSLMRRGSGIPCLILLNEKDEVIAQSYTENGSYHGPGVALKAYEEIKKNK